MVRVYVDVRLLVLHSFSLKAHLMCQQEGRGVSDRERLQCCASILHTVCQHLCFAGGAHGWNPDKTDPLFRRRVTASRYRSNILGLAKAGWPVTACTRPSAQHPMVLIGTQQA
jgi:hypothetical protein